MADASVRRFAYRYPRFVINTAMDFIVGDTVVIGACESISEAGVYVRLADKLQPGNTGIITLYFGAESYSVHATVAKTAACTNEQDYAALNFVFNDDEEKEAMRSLIARHKLRRVS